MKISDYSKDIMTICRKHGVASLAVFGSVLTDQFTPASDIDFLVVFRFSMPPEVKQFLRSILAVIQSETASIIEVTV